MTTNWLDVLFRSPDETDDPINRDDLATLLGPKLLPDAPITALVERLQRLQHGQPRVTHVLDATQPGLHLGQLLSVALLNLLAQAGCQVQLVDTEQAGRIGDPTGHGFGRRPYLGDTASIFARHRRHQLQSLLHPNVTITAEPNTTSHQILGWARRLDPRDLLSQPAFAERQHQGQPIGLDELLYQVMLATAYFELGTQFVVAGADQVDNVRLAAWLLKSDRCYEPLGLFTPLLLGIHGDSAKMGWTERNVAPIAGGPLQLMADIMTLADTEVMTLLAGLGHLRSQDLPALQREVSENPRRLKLLAAELVTAIIKPGTVSQRREHAAAIRAGYEAFDRTKLEDLIPRYPGYHPLLASPGESLLAILDRSGRYPEINEVRKLFTTGHVCASDGIVLDLNLTLKVSRLAVHVGTTDRFLIIAR